MFGTAAKAVSLRIPFQSMVDAPCPKEGMDTQARSRKVSFVRYKFTACPRLTVFSNSSFILKYGQSIPASHGFFPVDVPSLHELGNFSFHPVMEFQHRSEE